MLDARPHVDPTEERSVDLQGTVIGRRYELGAAIGQGSMARIFSARDLETDQPVAVKILAKAYASLDQERTRFFREANAAVRIKHPNVVKVLAQGIRDDGRPYIVIELLRGETLGERLRREGNLTPPEAFKLLCEAAAGLEAVHAADIVHRDMKPDNMFLVGSPGEPKEVRLVDFGLAKLHLHHSSQVGTTLGSAPYMPPEQVLAEAVDPRADIYSLGVVMFRMLTGHLPFEGKAHADMLAHQLFMAAPPPSWLVDNLDPRVDAVVQRAMRKRPGNRYPDMASMRRDIELLKSESSEPLAESPPVQEPDAYEPQTQLGRDAALLFCRKLGITPPSWFR